MSGRVWDPVARALAPRRVLAPDARGHGDSGADTETRPWKETGLTDLTALTDALCLERFALVGHSMGADVSLRYCARHPERVERLVLVDAGPDLPAASRRRQRPTPRRSPPLTGFESEQAYANALGVMYPRAGEEALRELARHWLRRRPDGRYEPKLDPGFLRPRPERVGQSGSESEEREHLWTCLGEIRCPLLIVRGAESTVLSDATARHMQSVSRDARRVELSAAGHAVMLDAPAAFVAALVDFLH